MTEPYFPDLAYDTNVARDRRNDELLRANNEQVEKTREARRIAIALFNDQKLKEYPQWLLNAINTQNSPNQH